MSFNSLVGFYYLLPVKFRWWLILLSSIAFYIWANPVSIFVPLAIIAIVYASAIFIERNMIPSQKKIIYIISVTAIIAILVFYKYAYFFISSLTQSVPANSFFASVIAPLGISYITFQSIGYLIEVHRENIAAEKKLGHFAAYLLFFPKIMAGPVERAQHFLPQLKKETRFNYGLVTEGVRQFGWGLFKKLVIADRLGMFVNSVYDDLHHSQGPGLLTACILFAFQLYADFSGYTDMALGASKILGYELAPNFNLPFSAKSLSDFWRRWHISLSGWFNDYFYTPLSISIRSWNKWGTIFSCVFTFMLLGLWHGANWTYIVFGGMHGTMVAAEFLTTRPRKRLRNKIPAKINSVIGILYTFLFFSFSCVFFRSNTVADAVYVLSHLFSGFTHWFTLSALKLSIQGHQLVISDFVILLLSIFFMFLVESKALLKKVSYLPSTGRWAAYYFFLIVVIVYSAPSGSGFIYKQF
jgi:alginate O-acetyltransferase complex protein AlgI